MTEIWNLVHSCVSSEKQGAESRSHEQTQGAEEEQIIFIDFIF
jgi:hypothetical protein